LSWCARKPGRDGYEFYKKWKPTRMVYLYYRAFCCCQNQWNEWINWRLNPSFRRHCLVHRFLFSSFCHLRFNFYLKEWYRGKKSIHKLGNTMERESSI
jgi:hypothetical protein